MNGSAYESSGRFTHKVVTRPAISLAQDTESSPARTGGLITTMLRHLIYQYTFCLFAATGNGKLKLFALEHNEQVCAEH